MRKWIPYAVFGLVVGAATLVRGQSNAGGDKKKYDTVDAQVVSVDAEGMTITVKVGDAEQTEKVSALARTRLSGVKAGDKVSLTRKDVDGKREVVSIRPAKEPAKKP
jgi:Cu/Ag efflux protein CusF